MLILGSGPNRIGQGIEFDYCCVQAVRAFRRAGYEAIMVNCNPETVSTDYDISDRLYFEPLTIEDVLAVVEREQPLGVVAQFGGQTPLRLARTLVAEGVPILGTDPAAIDLAEDRERFGGLLAELGLRAPEWAIAGDADEAVAVAERIGYPVLVRPSYVLGGRAMRVCYGADDVRALPVVAELARRPLPRGRDRGRRRRGLGRRDGADRRRHAARRGGGRALGRLGLRDAAALARSRARGRAASPDRRDRPGLGVRGLVNVQFALHEGEIYVLEANPRASRTVPFVEKAVGVDLVGLACRVALGERLADIGAHVPELVGIAVKEAVLPFARFPGSDPVLGPEMRSTGEVMALAPDFPTAYAKASRAAGLAAAVRAERRPRGRRSSRSATATSRP